MNQNQLLEIVKSEESKANIFLNKKETLVALKSMLVYGERAIDNYRKSESKEVKLEAVKLFPSLLKGNYKMWLRKRSFLKAKKMAQQRANIENRKVYCIRSSEIEYTLLSTQDVLHGKRLNLFGKKVGFLELTAAADFIAMPEK